ncbi:hypothetical protein A3860_02610 [Niastella vici]|uniref:UspA domain-containing protein n=1 Tax=Niastella vici TaxID=1703345 RepID=A0A1V9G9X1_9BACT|nr:universal stress protein [Niastella vici]OQP67266.1 hypothetical protein A3860_02610 [Niastella vici]
MRNVLVHTDFSAASFDLVEKAIHTMGEQVLNITLFHAFQMPFFVNDLIRNQRKPYHDLLTDAFRNNCKQIKQQYPRQVNSIVFRHLYGNTPAVFRHFVDANDIDLIVYPELYEFVQVHPDSVNPDTMFKKSRVPLLRQFKSKRRVITIPEIRAVEEEAVALLKLLNAQS